MEGPTDRESEMKIGNKSVGENQETQAAHDEKPEKTFRQATIFFLLPLDASRIHTYTPSEVVCIQLLVSLLVCCRSFFTTRI